MSPTQAPAKRVARSTAPSPRGSLTAPRTRPRPPVRTPTPRSTPRTAPQTTNRTAPKPAPRRTEPPRAIRTAGPRPGARRRLGVIVVLGIVVMLTIVGFHAVLAQNQVALDRTRARIATAEARYENERLKNSLLSSPARITQRATELGLTTPGIAPISVAIPGEAPKRGSETSAFGGYTEVKRHLDSSP